MDKETEIRRTINYLTDFIETSEAILNGNPTCNYYDCYRTYQEIASYLRSSTGKPSPKMPQLIRPNIFNKRLSGIWLICVLGVFNPFVSIMIIAATLPISLPLLVVRGITLTRTKNKIGEARLYLLTVVNELKKQRIEMTQPL